LVCVAKALGGAVGVGRVVVGAGALVIVVAYVYIAGELFAGVSLLYATGTVEPATVEACLAEWPSVTRGQWSITLWARTSAVPEPVSILWCTPASVGEPVRVVYRAAMGHGAGVRGRANLFDVLFGGVRLVLPARAASAVHRQGKAAKRTGRQT